jgi:hypothetical protein
MKRIVMALETLAILAFALPGASSAADAGRAVVSANDVRYGRGEGRFQCPQLKVSLPLVLRGKTMY